MRNLSLTTFALISIFGLEDLNAQANVEFTLKPNSYGEQEALVNGVEVKSTTQQSMTNVNTMTIRSGGISSAPNEVHIKSGSMQNFSNYNTSITTLKVGATDPNGSATITAIENKGSAKIMLLVDHNNTKIDNIWNDSTIISLSNNGIIGKLQNNGLVEQGITNAGTLTISNFYTSGGENLYGKFGLAAGNYHLKILGGTTTLSNFVVEVNNPFIISATDDMIKQIKVENSLYVQGLQYGDTYTNKDALFKKINGSGPSSNAGKLINTNGGGSGIGQNNIKDLGNRELEWNPNNGDEFRLKINGDIINNETADSGLGASVLISSFIIGDFILNNALALALNRMNQEQEEVKKKYLSLFALPYYAYFETGSVSGHNGGFILGASADFLQYGDVAIYSGYEFGGGGAKGVNLGTAGAYFGAKYNWDYRVNKYFEPFVILNLSGRWAKSTIGSKLLNNSSLQAFGFGLDTRLGANFYVIPRGHFSSFFGFKYQGIDTPIFQIAHTNGAKEYYNSKHIDMLFLNGGVGYEQQINDKIELFAEVGGAGRVTADEVINLRLDLIKLASTLPLENWYVFSRIGADFQVAKDLVLGINYSGIAGGLIQAHTAFSKLEYRF